ncbi:hypothetical protein B566_EDAN001721 [Ephemera danica]|nr:hypothetical protein B566_EDAN001721 [Ephemera danica]
MSRLYDRMWCEAVATLGTAASLDAILQSAKPEKDRKLSHTMVVGLYAKYTLAINKLDLCYDQMVQPQKRILVRKLLDGSIGRLLEIKMRALPVDAEVVVPRYYRRAREQEIAQRKAHLDAILKKLGVYDEQGAEAAVSEEEAVRLVQSHERARQGRLRANFMRQLTLLKSKYRPTRASSSAAIIRSIEDAAVILQKTWRGLQSRKITRQRKQDEMMLIGMVPHVGASASELTTERKRSQLVQVARRTKQDEYQQKYIEAQREEKERALRRHGIRLTKEITDEVRNWLMEYKNETGKFPDFPSEEMGGSALMFGKQGTESEVSKSTVGSSREGKSRKDRLKKPKEKETKKTKNSAGDDDDPGFKMQPSNFLNNLLAANTEYEEVWRNREEQHNPLQHHYMDMVQAAKQAEVERELRLAVDNALRCELELLKAALDRDRAKKGKKVKKSGKKKGRKGGKKGKKKREKDLTPDRTLESLFEEMVTQGIIKRYPHTPLSSFFGECSFAAHEQRQLGREPSPCLGDVRRLINEYCILPLGCKELHQAAPLVRSLLLTGPSGSGKELILHAICSELGAVLFDLTPANIAGKYPGKAGLTMLVHLINKVSRLVQPSVLYMDSAEKPFMKKVPKQDRTDPKRLKKDLPKIVKGIGPDDQIILIGNSNNPWECDQKSLAQTYHKLILLPKPDYGSLSALWQSRLLHFPPSACIDFSVAAMARVCDGYAMGTVFIKLYTY